MYSVAEGDSVDVCAIILGPEQIAMGLEAFAMLTAVPGTADGEYFFCHYYARKMYQSLFLFLVGRDHIPFMNVVFLTTDMRKICYSFTAILDGVPENIEFVTVELQSIPGFTTEIVNIDSSRQTAQVFISEQMCNISTIFTYISQTTPLFSQHFQAQMNVPKETMTVVRMPSALTHQNHLIVLVMMVLRVMEESVEVYMHSLQHMKIFSL